MVDLKNISRRESMSPDELCGKYSKEKIAINIECDEDMVFIRGSKLSLKFLGELFIAQAKFEKDDGFQIEPNGPGNIFFNKKSKFGLYIKRDE